MNRLYQYQVKDFALAGNAILTLQSGKTGNHYTYKILKSNNRDDLYIVKRLYGSDNENDYEYVGCYFSDTEIFVPAKTYKDRTSLSWPPSMRAIRYFFEKIDNIPDSLIVFHEGKCGKCGKKLTTPESIRRGFGPECYKEIVNNARL